MKKITILGDGGWGTALAMVLARNGHDIRVWGPFPDYIEQVQTTRENSKFLPGIQLPTEISWTADRKEAASEADIVVIAVPTRFYSQVVTSFKPFVKSNAIAVSVSKGLDRATHKRMTEVAATVFSSPVAALSGPSHAEEVAKAIPSAVVIASTDRKASEQLQHVFTNETFRVYTSDDVIGTELGGALKNVIALAAGVCDGIGYGDNTKAALITRGLAEMTRLGVALKANASTFSGLSGMGDLIVTCTSKLSRNRSVGERLGRGESMDSIQEGMEQVAEGVWNCINARELAKDVGVEVPITQEVCAVIHEGKDPRTAVQALLGRDPRSENE